MRRMTNPVQSSDHTKPRLAIVQHGDYRDALEILQADAPEPYFGMKHSVRLMEHFLQGTEYRLISVDAPNYVVKRECGQLVGLHRPSWKKLSKLPWSWSVYRQVREFRPTHLLMRTGGVLAYPSLRWACAHGVNSLVVMAGYMQGRRLWERRLQKDLVRLLNHPNVFLACNHRRPAALSTIHAGVMPEKVWAWDFVGLPDPKDHPVKSLSTGRNKLIVFAGQLAEGKGIGDLVEAFMHLNPRMPNARLVICGDGDLRPQLEGKCKSLPADAVKILGRVGNDTVQRLMKEADLVCVPSRKDCSEGLPFTFTEALANRTPVIATDHPSITHLIGDGMGIRIVPSRNPVALAAMIEEVLKDPQQYARLSEKTIEAHRKVGSDITFDDLLATWRASWK
jgi:glycosyltransferase involved in cell wall biosynthesis